MNWSFADVNEAYHEVMTMQHHFTHLEDTRNGPAYAFQEPVIIAHLNPSRRVLFDPIRDANPFFHFMEALWMMSGSDSVRFPAQFAKNLKNYSDDGHSLNGAYGHRWARNFMTNQIEEVIQLLKKDPKTRRAVIAMWDPNKDWEPSLDLPCNTHVYFRLVNDQLTMTVCNRSNDVVWGALGANVVHMSLLQEYVASAIGKVPGTYYQMTNNLHVYQDWTRKYGPPVRWYSKNRLYASIVWSPTSLNLNEAWEFVLHGLDTDKQYKCDVIARNAVPMMEAWVAHKEFKPNVAMVHARNIFDEDWREACVSWLERRAANVEETPEG